MNSLFVDDDEFVSSHSGETTKTGSVVASGQPGDADTDSKSDHAVECEGEILIISDPGIFHFGESDGL